jgi:hypothetical protein
MNLHEAFDKASHLDDVLLVSRAESFCQQNVLANWKSLPLLYLAVAFEAGRIFETAAKEKK